MFPDQNPWGRHNINVNVPRGLQLPRGRTILKLWIAAVVFAMLAPLLGLLALGGAIALLNYWQPW